MKRSNRAALTALIGISLITPLIALAQPSTQIETAPRGDGAHPIPQAPTVPAAVIAEGFDVVVGGCVAGWNCQNLSNPVGTAGWFQGNSAVFPAHAGDPTSYIGANFNNTTGTNTIDNWLITPQLNFANGAELRFWTQVPNASPFPDRLEVRLSTAGTSTAVANFSALLTTINPTLQSGVGTCPPGVGPYPQSFCEIVLTNINGIPTSGSGRIAFRYFVTNGGPTGTNSNYIGIDTFSYNDGLVVTTPLQNFDSVSPPALVAGWIAASTTSANWISVAPGSPAATTAPNVMQVAGNVFVTDASLTSEPFTVSSLPAQLAFDQSRALEAGFDGMVLDVSINGGPFVDAVTSGGSFVAGGYNGSISASFGSPIGGRSAWTGTQATFSNTVYQLPAAAVIGSSVRFRWRVATDSAVASGATQIDSIAASGLVGGVADLSVILTDVPDPVTAGTNLTYTATITNNGPGVSNQVSLSLPLPVGTSLVSASPSSGGSCNGGSTVICTWAGATNSGATRSATVVALVSSSLAAGNSLFATATASSSTTDPNAANNSANASTAVNASANLQLTPSTSATQVVVNAPVTLTATSVNQGPSNAQNVSVATALGAPLRYSSHVATGATCTTPAVGTSGTITCTWAGATAPGASRTLAVTGSGNVAGTSTIQMSTTSSTTDPVPANNTAQFTVQVTGGAAPVINSFSATPSSVVAGATITLNWTSSNAASCTPVLGGATTWNSLTGLPTSGSRAVAAPQVAGSVTFQLNCTNGTQLVSSQATVNVTPGNAPAINWFYPTLATVTVGQPITLNWSAGNVTSCSPTLGAGTVWNTLGTLPIGGSRGLTAPQSVTSITFQLNCTNGAQTIFKTTQVNVIANTNPTANLSVPMTTVPSCDPLLDTYQMPISWTSSNAAFCVASENPAPPMARTTWPQFACLGETGCPDAVDRKKLRPNQVGDQLFILNNNAGTSTTLRLECFARVGGPSAVSQVTLNLVAGTFSQCPLTTAYTPNSTATAPASMPDGSFQLQSSVSNPQGLPLTASVLQQGQHGDITVEMVGDTVTVNYYPRVGDFPEATVVNETIQVLIGNGSSGVPVTYTFQVDLARFSNGFEGGSTVALVENFDGLAGNPACPAGWSCVNLSSPLGTTTWFSGNPDILPTSGGASAPFIAANFNSTTGATGTISTWLISPPVNFAAGQSLRFWTSTPPGSTFPDRLEIRASTGGASPGGTAISVGDFTIQLGVVNPSFAPGPGVCVTPAAAPGNGGYPQTWCEYRLTSAQGLPITGTGRIAFRYTVPNGGPTGVNSNYIGIDSVRLGGE